MSVLLRARPARLPRRASYATVEIPVIVAKPPLPAKPPVPQSHNPIDALILTRLANTPSSSHASLPALIDQYLNRSGQVLPSQLPYEPHPSAERRVSTHPSSNGVHLIAHVVTEGARSKIALSSAFAISGAETNDGNTTVVTCAHTLEEIRWSPLLVLPDIASSPPAVSLPDLPRARSSGSFLITTSDDTHSTPRLRKPVPTFHPINSVLSSLHRSDLLLLSASASLRTLPISPYPALSGTRIRAHFVSETKPAGDKGKGWEPWVGGWAKWVSGRVLGYRDLAGRETQPGTYDALSHMLFEPPPTAGSSGGPIVDEETGAVVGVMLGTRMDNRIEGVRGWGVPSEAIFEMFSLPGQKPGGR